MSKKKEKVQFTPIVWRLVLPDAINHVFRLEDRKSWKGAMIRGYDIAEMIMQEIWDSKARPSNRIEIVEPEIYRGIYEIKTEFEPIFSAKRVDI